jgi:toxin FitB
VRYLVDANVLAEAIRSSPNQSVVRWLQDTEASLVVDPVILGELYAGILALAHGKKRDRLDGWFEAVVRRIDCVDWDSETGLRWARLVVEMKRRGRTIPVRDSMIAATALRHGFTLATRNVRDF